MDNSDSEKQFSDMKERFRGVFASAEGREVLRFIIASGGVTVRSFRPDPFDTAFQEGRRSLALEILGMCEEPAKFVESTAYEDTY